MRRQVLPSLLPPWGEKALTFEINKRLSVDGPSGIMKPGKKRQEGEDGHARTERRQRTTAHGATQVPDLRGDSREGGSRRGDPSPVEPLAGPAQGDRERRRGRRDPSAEGPVGTPGSTQRGDPRGIRAAAPRAPGEGASIGGDRGRARALKKRAELGLFDRQRTDQVPSTIRPLILGTFRKATEVLGRARAADALNLSLRTIERWEAWRSGDRCPRSGNPAPHNTLLPQERALVRELVGAPELVALSPRELSFVALEDRGEYVSHVAFWRYMRERGLYEGATPRCRRRARGAEPPDTRFATEPNQLWTWDITHLLTYTPGLAYYLYTIMDWVSRKVVAWHLSESLASSEVPKVWDKAIAAENLVEVPRCLWPRSMSDRGTQMRSRYSRRYFALLTIDQLFGRPGTPNDQARIEAFFSTLKTHPFYPGRFETFEEALAWCEEYFPSYNDKHHHS